MRPLSQIDPFNGCPLCRRQYERGELPVHGWLHEAKTGFLRLVGGVIPSWTYGTDPKKHEPPEPPAIGTSSVAIGLAGVSFSLLADKLRKGSEDEIRLGSLESYYNAGRLAALLAEKYRPSTVKEATDAE